MRDILDDVDLSTATETPSRRRLGFIKAGVWLIVAGAAASACAAERATQQFVYDGSFVPGVEGAATAPQARWTVHPGRDVDASSTQGLRSDGEHLIIDEWPALSYLRTPAGVMGPFAVEGCWTTLEVDLQVLAGRLYFLLHDGQRKYQFWVAPTGLAFSKIAPSEAIRLEEDFASRVRRLRVELRGGQVAIAVDGQELARQSAGLGGEAAGNYLQIMALDAGALPTARIDHLRIDASVRVETPPADLSREPVWSAWPAREFQREGLSVTVGPIRTLLRGARTPMITAFRDGTILLTGGSKTTGARTIRSADRGQSWRLQDQAIAHLNTLELSDGRMLVIGYDPEPMPDRPGDYRVRRWFSTDYGRTLSPAEDGTLHLPADRFDPKLIQWFHGNLIQLPDGDLLTVMQGQERTSEGRTFRLFLVRSRDLGRTWRYESMVADHAALAPIRDRLTANGWRLHGGVEPALAHLGDGRLVCIARVVDDESNLRPWQFGPASETYHDLNYTVAGDGIYPGLAQLPSDRYYTPGPPSAPLIICRSEDGGRTWSLPEPTAQARGCFPRLTVSEDGILALTYGGLAAPRWGNCVSFSFDGGQTWTQEINFGPFLTTGYTGVVAVGPGRFVAFFDCTPPQPWTNHDAHWIGAVDLTVQRTQP